MNGEYIEEKIVGLLESVRTEASPGLRERAVAAIVATRSMRTRSRYRLAVVAAGAAVALIGLGFVPFPAGSASGALDRALAMAEEARTVHMTGHAWTAEGESDFERWISEDGFSRRERWEGRELVDLELSNGYRELKYHVPPDDGEPYALEYFNPSRRHSQSTPMPDRSYVEGFFESFGLMAEQLGINPPDMRIGERRERSLWGGMVDIVEAEWTVEGRCGISGVDYSNGDRIRIRAQIDPRSNRLRAMTHHKFEGTWEPTYQAEYAWDVEIPEALREFRPPNGTTLERILWWEKRIDQVLASESTRDWEVTLHAVDVDRSGDLCLSLSRMETPESRMSRGYNSAIPIRVRAVGSSGDQYTQLNRYSCYGNYWTTTLEREQAGTDPRTVTLTIRPYSQGISEDQSVTFHGIPLPPRQDVEDVYLAGIEEIQY